MDRQEILAKERPPRIRAILDEAVLRRLVGGPDVMRQQLRHLLDLTRSAAIEIRVLGPRPAVHADIYGAFTIFEMPTPYPAVAYVENWAGRLYVEEPKAEKFVRAYDALLKTALGTRESATYIASIAEEL